jgi:PAS domain S-box-containing protein
MQNINEPNNVIEFSDIFNLDDIQRIQDLFADATGVASIITYPDGTPITKPSNFCRLCNEIIRKTDIGLSNCIKSDAEIGKSNLSGPIIKQCLSGGLWDAGASIVVNDKHIANWLIGQIKNEELDLNEMRLYAKKIGADENDFMSALEEVPDMSRRKFEQVANMLFAFSNEISSKVYQNSQLIQSFNERKLTEEKLNKEQYLMRNLMDNLPDHIYFKDLESRFIRVNSTQAQMFGFKDPDKLIGKTDFDFFSEEHAKQAYEDEQNIILTGQSLIKEEKETWEDRPDNWVHTTKVSLRNEDGNIVGTFGISRDITDRKLAEEEIQLKNELLQTINAEKDKFFSILAHDLKGPLSAFLDATQILTEEIHKMSLDEIKDITISMKESASSIYGLLENLLEWSRLKQGRLDFKPERIFVKQKITNCTEILKESARKKSITLNFSLPDDLDVTADSHMFETIIRNLVSNAIKFTPKSGAIFISAKRNPDNSAEIAVRDTGIGMDKAMICRLFLLNGKTNREGTDGEPSTGLGLLLCKEFIEKQNGKIWVESEVGKGSTFFFSLM